MPSRRPSTLGMSLQQHEIGPEARPPRRPENRVGQGARKVPRQFPLIVHDLGWLTMAPERRDFTLRARTHSSASSRMSVRRSHGYPLTLLLESCTADVRPRNGASGQQTESVGVARQTTRPPGAALDSPLEFC